MFKSRSLSTFASNDASDSLAMSWLTVIFDLGDSNQYDEEVFVRQEEFNKAIVLFGVQQENVVEFLDSIFKAYSSFL